MIGHRDTVAAPSISGGRLGLIAGLALAGVGGVLVATHLVAVGVALLVLFCVVMIVNWRRWQIGDSQLGGAPVYVFLAGVVVYLVGSYSFASRGVFGSVITDAQWRMYLLAALVCAVVVIIPGKRPSAEHAVLREYPAWPILLAAAVGLGVSWINFATGSIPLFADSINEARKDGIGGSLAPLSFLGYPSLHFAILAALFLPSQRLSTKARFILTGLCVGTLLLTGSRSFLVLPVLACLVLYVESKRPSLWKIAATGLVIIIAVSAAGVVRASASGQVSNLTSNAQRFGYGGGARAAVLSNLQPGPRVMAVTLEAIPRRIPYQHGEFLLRDMPVLSPGVKSDYWVTDQVMLRDSTRVGGLPPTLLGGLYIDFGPAGAILGPALLFLFTRWARPQARDSLRSNVAQVAYALFCAYLLSTFYSYFSLKGSILVVFAWLLLLARTAVVAPAPDRQRSLRQGA